MAITLMPMTYELSTAEQEVVDRLRSVGCALTLFLPQEIEDAETTEIEARMCMVGWDVINEANAPD